MARLGQALASRAPLVLFLDDVQWADVATRDLLHYVVRRWAEGGARTMLLLAVRAEDVGRQRALEQWLEGLEREAPTTLELEPLAAEDVVHLVAALAGIETEEEDAGSGGPGVQAAALGQWLADQTGGHLTRH